MEVVTARSALLSNYEVYKLLTDQRRKQGESGRNEASGKGKGKAADIGEAAGAATVNSNCVTGTVPPNLSKIQDETIEYLKLTPHATLRQNEPSIAKLLEELRTVGDSDGGGAGLTKAEKLMVVNLAPTTDVELYTIVEELEDRLPTEIQTILGMVSDSLLPEPMEDIETTNGFAGGANGAGESGLDDDAYGEEAEDAYGEYEQPQEFYSEPAYGNRPDTPPELDES